MEFILLIVFPRSRGKSLVNARGWGERNTLASVKRGSPLRAAVAAHLPRERRRDITFLIECYHRKKGVLDTFPPQSY
jgi:hypothetical protein